MFSNSLIKKWSRMLTKKSVLHVQQDVGTRYSVEELAGYYNDFREKIKTTKNIDDNGIPYNIASRGKEKKRIYFSIAIFQYGLGAYDLWLETKDDYYHDIFFKTVDWAINNQLSNGAWNTFDVLEYKNPFSAMAQGEGASLLARAYNEKKDILYLNACKLAIDFMLLPIEHGGTAVYKGEECFLYEYPSKKLVLNGWIFSAFGILDIWKISKEYKYYQLWIQVTNTIITHLRDFDAGHWSYYDVGGKYTSPFYHSLHISLLSVLCSLNESAICSSYCEKWKSCNDSFIWSKFAFVKKALQKIFEKQNDEWVIVE